MAGEIIRPKDLTLRPAPVASELMVVDNSVNVGAATIKAVVEAGRPAASQAEAQAGTDAAKAMTPLTTKQSIAAEVGVTVASKAQGDLAATAVQPSDLSAVATTGAYADLSGKPVLGTAAATDATAYATATQGGKADTALQSVVPGLNVAIDNTDPRNPIVSASGGAGGRIPSRAWAIANLHPAAAPDSLRTDGYASAGDGGGALYKKVASEPSHAGKFSITLADGVTVVWYEIAETVLRPEMFGASLVAESQAQLQAMFSTDATEFYLPAGVWRADSDIIVTRPNGEIHIHGQGVLDFSNAASAQLVIEGSITALDQPNTNMAKYSKVIRWAVDQGLAPGDVVILWNPADYSFGGRRAVYRDGGMFKMHSLASGTGGILVYELIPDAYTAANFNAYKLNGIKARIEGISAKPCSTSEKAPILVRFGEDVVYRDIKSLAGGTYGGVQVDRCYNVVFDCVTPENNSAHVNNEYGVIISSSQHVKVHGSLALATRHAVTMGTNGQEASVPVRYVHIEGMSLHNCPASGTGAGDVHGNGDFITYANCTMKGFSGGGRNIKVVDCTIFGMPELASGMCVTMPESNGGYVDFIDCEFLSQGDGADSNHGYIFIQAIGSGALGEPVEAWIRETMHVRVKNCRFVTPNAGVLAKMVAVSASNSNVKVNVDIRDCEWIAPQGYSFLFARETINTNMLSDGLVVDAVRGPNDVFLIAPQSSVVNVPTREMQQSGKTDITTTASTSAPAAGVISLRYKYSRLPDTFVSVSSVDGTSLGALGGQLPVPSMLTYSGSTVRPQVRAAAAFTAGASARLNWNAGVFGI